jgi:hypothetical protein
VNPLIKSAALNSNDAFGAPVLDISLTIGESPTTVAVKVGVEVSVGV